MHKSQERFKIVLKLHTHSTTFLNLIQHILDLAQVVKKWWIITLLFYCLCIKDLINIYIYSTLTIIKRTLWMLQTVGFYQTTHDSSLSYLSKITQTEMIKKKDAQSSPFENPRAKLHTSSQTSPLKLPFSPPKFKIEEITVEDIKHNLAAKETSPAILQIEAETPRKKASRSATHLQTPLCNINLSHTPTRFKELNNLSPEERSFLKSKCHSFVWKLKKFIKKMNIRSIFQNYQRNSDGVLPCSELHSVNFIFSDGDNKKLYEEPDTPDCNGCCNSLATKLKLKLHREGDYPAVSYRR